MRKVLGCSTMHHKIDFYSPQPGTEHYRMEWDDQTGAVTGESAEIIKQWAKFVLENGGIACDELNGEIPATDPLKNKSEFAALIGFDNLPDSLKPFYPSSEYPGFVSFDDVTSDENITPLPKSVRILF
jgi:hypothetical protein